MNAVKSSRSKIQLYFITGNIQLKQLTTFLVLNKVMENLLYYLIW